MDRTTMSSTSLTTSGAKQPQNLFSEYLALQWVHNS